MSKKILIAFSGGVDSAVASLILKDKGYDVTAAFIRNTNSFLIEKKAKSLAKKIGISFLVFDFKKEFNDIVIKYFIEEYKKGLTPNPCVLCNKEIKFGLFLKKAINMNFDFIATGHYASIKNGLINQARDLHKDQTYFLWRLNKKQISRIIFPLENYTKEEVRIIAKDKKIDSFVVSESQEICFIKSANEEFLRKNIKNKKGSIVDKNKNIIGYHDGIWFYTIGQRKGIGLSGGPYWVIDKNIKKNELIVSKSEKDLYLKEVLFKNANWTKKIDIGKRLKAKIRYGHKQAFGVLISNNKFVFEKPQKSITKGQSIVFYNKKEVIGGGIIK
ncbi:MAG: tRNA 2-thiouridine(34) synthase MnmA [Candidatus Pacebacteria bacterium]|nr:tRNA 2-thiouridine(34) synthase MnmA [Candidatus Paceibacterota bacterium]MDD4074092.1 tRNA 2-thiouridine(34) synthase MnmA [Candidatus Paceibacterota bacterium]